MYSNNNTTTSVPSYYTRHTHILWIPPVYLWIASVMYGFWLACTQPNRRRFCHASYLNWAKVVLSTTLTIDVLVRVVYSGTVMINQLHSEEYIRDVFIILTYVLSVVMTRYEFMKGVHSSCVLFFYWLLSVALYTAPVFSLMTPHAIKDRVEAVTLCVEYILLVVQLVLSAFSDIAAFDDSRPVTVETPLLMNSSSPQNSNETSQQRKRSAEETASFLSRCFFFWITSLIWLGWKKHLVYDDLPHLKQEYKTSNQLPLFIDQWTKEEQRSRSIGKINKVSLWRVLVRTLYPRMVMSGLSKLAYDIINFATPIILSILLSYIESGDPSSYKGYLYGLLLFMVITIRTLSGQWHWHQNFLLGMKARTNLVGVIYKKVLKLSSSAREKLTVGEIVNLMAVDVQKIQDAPMYLNFIWSVPLNIAVGAYLLWQQLGVASLTGVTILISLIPINIFIAVKVQRLQVTQMMFKDNRAKMTNEILTGIKVVKLYAWELPFISRILSIRDKEQIVLNAATILTSASSIAWTLVPFLTSLLSFGTFVLLSPENILDANKVFVTMTVIGILSMSFSMLPIMVLNTSQALVSLKRLEKFLQHEEIDSDKTFFDPSAEFAVEVNMASFTWSHNVSPTLTNIMMNVIPGEFVAIVGQVGAGKSSLLSALLGEMEILQGSVKIKSSVAYVPQQAWIQNKTLRDNILFGKDLKSSYYHKVLEACALSSDLQILPGGDLTEIGQNGVNLSGGQKQRISLARSVYQNCNIYLLDDPLSAVDANVGKHIFQNILGSQGMLRKETRILVTNQLTYLRKMDKIIVMKDGMISEYGTFNELSRQKGALSELVAEHLLKMISDNDKDYIDDGALSDIVSSYLSEFNSTDDEELSYDGMLKNISKLKRNKKSKKRRSKSPTQKRDGIIDESPHSKDLELDPVVDKSQLIEEEQAQKGSMRLAQMCAFLKACGLRSVTVVAGSCILSLVTMIAAGIWLAEWSGDELLESGYQDVSLRNYRLEIYGLIGAAQTLFVLIYRVVIATMGVRASGILHSQLLKNILQAPMSFFDTTPTGRILNRFTRDMDIMDVNIPMTMRIWMSNVLILGTVLVIITYSTPTFLVIAIFLAAVFVIIQRVYIKANRQIRRIDSIQRSPINEHFSDTITGASSIRAYKRQEEFNKRTAELVDISQQTYYPTFVCERWLGTWTGMLANLAVLTATMLAVQLRERLGASFVGLSVTYSLQLTQYMAIFAKCTCDLENYVISIERVLEYINCPQEAPAINEDKRPEADWPDSGHVKFNNYSTRYRVGLDLVLRDVSFDIAPTTRVGIVGRTGAGKSSLTLALFRIIEAATGTILIDNVDINQIGLRDLRSKLTIIPQDPILFMGTLRLNLDPFDQHTDNEIWISLEQAHLKNVLSRHPAGLLFECTEGGDNLSVGQRQLVCLARALLRKTKILILDEATAAMDQETDDLIQTTIRTKFTGCTIITIAHRLNTILDYDKILVLDGGQIAEYDRPTTLITDKHSIFFSMVRDAGLVQ